MVLIRTSMMRGMICVTPDMSGRGEAHNEYLG